MKQRGDRARQIPPGLEVKLADAAGSLPVSFEDVRMDDIAQASGIPRATLYYYFAGKEDILAFLLANTLDVLSARAAAVAVGPWTVRRKLTEMIRVQLETLSASPAAAQLLLANLGRAGKLADIAASIDDAFLGPMSSLLQQGVLDGEVSERDVATVAAAVLGAVSTVGLLAVVLERDIDVASLAAELGDIFWRGVSSRAGGADASN